MTGSSFNYGDQYVTAFWPVSRAACCCSYSNYCTRVYFI